MNKQSLFPLFCAIGLACGAAACGKPVADVHPVGMCVRADTKLCATYTVQTELNLAQQATVSAFVRANCATLQGTFTGDAACSTADTVGYCTFGSLKANDVDIREVLVASEQDATTAQQLCSSQSGSWTAGVPTF